MEEEEAVQQKLEEEKLNQLIDKHEKDGRSMFQFIKLYKKETNLNQPIEDNEGNLVYGRQEKVDLLASYYEISKPNTNPEGTD